MSKKFSLNERDLDFIQTELKRNPTDDELSFIESIVTSIRTIRAKASVQGSESDLLPQIINIVNDTVLSIGQENKKSLFNSNRKFDLFLTGTEKRLDLKTGSTHSMVGVGKISKTEQSKPSRKCVLVLIRGKREINGIQKNQKEFNVQSSFPIFKSGFGYALYEMAQNLNCGFTLSMKQIGDFKSFNQNRWSGILLSVKDDDYPSFLKSANKRKISSMKIGTIIKDRRLDFIISKNDSVHINFSIFEFLKTSYGYKKVISFSSNSEETHYPEIQKSYSSLVLKLSIDTKNSPLVVKPKNAIINSDLAMFHINGQHKPIWVKNSIQEIVDSNYSTKQTAGMIMDISREMSCLGIKPVGLSVALGVKDVSNPMLATMFDSISFTSRKLQMTLQNRMIYHHQKNHINLNYTLVGVGLDSDRLVETAFQHPSDFILILGSLKGELGKSEYLKLKGQSFFGNDPLVDLNDELRLQDVLQMLAEGKLVHSAVSVTKGGISKSLIQCLKKSTPEIGARIYLNTKLRPDEMLFGESKSVALVTVSERNLMDFERICMKQGIPSTTIGRVTDDSLFTFNNLVKLTREKM